MKILALDSSGLTASAALIEDDKLTAEYSVNYKKTHSQTLVPMLEAIRDMTELDLTTLDAIAVAAGPGSFTGLRIGSATAKGLGLALEKPIIPVPTVDGLAYQMYGTDKLICPIMDARRGQVYTGLYEFVRTGTENPADYRLHVLYPQCAASIEEIADRCNRYAREVVFLGDGVAIFAGRLRALMKTAYSFAPAHRRMQSAAAVGVYAGVLYRQGVYESAAEHKPIYLRMPQAERERLEKGEGLIIRRMEEQDVPQVSANEAACFSDPWSENALAEAVCQKDSVYLVAELNGRIVGHCGVRNAAGDGYITNVAVCPDERRKGVGWRMLRALLQEGEKIGSTAFTLEVRAGNLAAVRLYEKAGFVSTGIRPGFYENPKEDALIMWKRQA